MFCVALTTGKRPSLIDFMASVDDASSMSVGEEKEPLKSFEDSPSIDQDGPTIERGGVSHLTAGQQVKVTMIGTLLEAEASGSSWLVRLGDDDVVVSVPAANLDHVSEEEASQLRSMPERKRRPSVFDTSKGAAAKAAQVVTSQAVARAADAKKVVSSGAAMAEAGVQAVGVKAQAVQTWLRKRLVSDPSSQPVHVSVARRRCTVVGVDNENDHNAEVMQSEEDRGLLVCISEENLAEWLNSSEATFIASSPHPEDPHLEHSSFTETPLCQMGKPLDCVESCLAYQCRKGLKAEPPNQDSFFVVRVAEDFSIYGVMDGHGQHGHTVARFVTDNLPKLFLLDQRFKCGVSDLECICKDAFAKMQSLIETTDKLRHAHRSGCTASVVIHDHQHKKITVAHIGDSTVCLVKKGRGVSLLTRDHRPDLPDEKARIEKAGGRVVFDGYANHRVYAKNARYPGLTLSRSFGDKVGHADVGIISTPEVSEYSLTPEDVSILVCSDGVWEFMSPYEAASILAEFPPNATQKAAEELVKNSWDRWIREEGGAVVDDITVIFANVTDESRRVVTCEGSVADDTA